MWGEPDSAPTNSELSFGTDPATARHSFGDPFLDFEDFLRNHYYAPASLPENSRLLFLFRAAWLDPIFYRNRTTFCFPIDSWRSEEFGLLLEVLDCLDHPHPFPLPVSLLTLFAVCTGRITPHLQFDPSTSENADRLSFRAPLLLRTNPGDGPSLISPTFMLRAARALVPLPVVHFTLITAIPKPRENPETQMESETSDRQAAFDFAGRKHVPELPLSFDRGPTLSIRITRFPLRDGTFWVRVTSVHFAIAFGEDISNGITLHTKYRWENRVSGACPPTLGESGEGKVLWIDDPLIEMPALESPILAKYCAASTPDSLEEVAAHIRMDDDLPANWQFIWADPETGRIRDVDLHILQDQEAQVSVLECNDSCPCQRRCKCCFSTQRSVKQLMLYNSADKGWGIAATGIIEAGSLVCIYGGRLRNDPHPERESSEYYFTAEFGDLRNDTGFDALNCGNISRFVNGVCSNDEEPNERFGEPNVIALTIVSTSCCVAKIGFFARRKIYPGEEILIYYGPWFQNFGTCQCNTCLRARAQAPRIGASRQRGRDRRHSRAPERA
jgi:hypothetical protein